MHRVVALILITAGLPLFAQTNPHIRLVLKCGKSPCTFRLGEVIPIELSFTSTVPKRYQLNMAQYDRSGRMQHEQFQVVPQEGTRDPLRMYFSFGGFIGGGLHGIQFLSAEPAVIKLVLNEWISFDRPGVYRLKLTISRVRDTTLDWKEGSKEVAPNEIELEIVPADPEWQQRELQRIVKALDDPKRKPETERTAEDPLTALRYLGTEAAARELARRFGTESTTTNADLQCMFGLIGSLNSAAGLAEMRARLRDPDFPVSSMFLHAMSYLPLRAGDPPEVLQKQHKENMATNHEALIEVLALKRGKALAVSTETALGASNSPPETLRKTLSQQLLANFEALPTERQANWLQYNWDLIKDRSWIPVLRKIATAYQDFPEFREVRAFDSLRASGIALRRWYELDPEGARSAVITEILREKPRYRAEVLAILREAELPEVEIPLVRNLSRTDNVDIESNILALLERYGAGGAVAELIASKSEIVGKWACPSQSHFLGYVLKFDPQAARPLIERAIESRGARASGCRRSIFTDLGSKHSGSILEELALKGLNDPDLEVAIDAARYLERYGSEVAEQPLWTRYAAWSRKWRGREQELRIIFGAEETPNLWERVSEKCWRALAQAVGWLCDEAKVRRVFDLAVGEGARSVVDSALKSVSSRSILFSPGYFDRTPSFTVAQHHELTFEQLRKKLAQYPAGTEFRWVAGQPGSPEQEAAFREVSAAAAEARVKLNRSL